MGATKLQGVSGSVTLDGGNPTGDFTVGIPAQNATLSSMTLMTSQTASGTSVDFTGIPSWAKRITVMFSGVSTSSTSPITIRIGSSTIDTTGYLSTNAIAATGAAAVNSTTGFLLTVSTTYTLAAGLFHGKNDITNINGNIWVSSGVTCYSTANSTFLTSGSKTLAGVLDRIRITTENGTDTFDAGTINIMYEG